MKWRQNSLFWEDFKEVCYNSAMAKYLQGLNPAQQVAVLHKDSPLLIIAGAGAGKTKTITHRIAHLIEGGVPPERILAVTFTNKAAAEMRGRIQGLLAENLMKKRDAGNPLVLTFHALGVKILRDNARSAGITKNFSIFDKEDSLSVIKEAMGLGNIHSKQFEPKKIQSAISRYKNALLSWEDIALREPPDFYSKIVSLVWKEYEALMQKKRALDFDDLLSKTFKLLTGHREIAHMLSDRFLFIHVDEYQDTNFLQYEITKILGEKHKNVCVVGDADQSIYSWRGALYKNLFLFEKDFPNTRIIILEENYRSTKTILAAANEIIEKNTNRHKKALFTKNKAGGKISLFSALTEHDEALFVAGEIQTLIKNNVSPSEIAVLYRTNFLSRIFEEQCIAHEIPYQVLGVRFFERKEIKDILAYIKLALDENDFVSMGRVINMPPRGLGKAALAKMVSGHTEKDFSPAIFRKVQLFNTLLSNIRKEMKRLPLSELIKYIIKESGMESYLNTGDEEGQERLENVRELVSLSTKYNGLPKGEGAEELLTDAALYASDYENPNGAKNDRVKLMTVHAAKGLEFKYVFIVGLEEDLFPHATMNENHDPEEERRLFYVALTRAKEKLYLSYTHQRTIFGGTHVNIPSQFIFDISENLLETPKVNISTINIE